MPATVPTNDGIPHVHIRNCRQGLSLFYLFWKYTFLLFHVSINFCPSSPFGYLYIRSTNSIIEHPVYRDRALLSILVSEQDAVSEMQMKLWLLTVEHRQLSIFAFILITVSAAAARASGHDACIPRLGAVRQSRLWDGLSCREWVGGGANVWWTDDTIDSRHKFALHPLPILAWASQ